VLPFSTLFNIRIISNNVTGIIFEDPSYGDFTDSQRQFQQEMLQAHNNYRACHSAPPLQLDHILSRSAQYIAERLASANQMMYFIRKGVGENLFAKNSSSVDGKEPTATWYDGIKYYDFNKASFSMGAGTFTQVVWANTKQLGVGIAFTDDGRSAYVVARYLPPGNYGNQYKENVFPAKC